METGGQVEPEAEPESKDKPPENPFVMMLLGQVIFLAAALTLSWVVPDGIFGKPVELLVGLDVNATAIGLGALLAGGMAGLLHLSETLFPRAMDRLTTEVIELYKKIGIKLTWPVIIALSLSAGICEELFFRGALQTWAAAYVPLWAAIAGIALLFGAAHAASWGYFVAATLAGLILGTAYAITGSLIAVMIAHALYDIWALRRLQRLMSPAAAV